MISKKMTNGAGWIAFKERIKENIQFKVPIDTPNQLEKHKLLTNKI